MSFWTTTAKELPDVSNHPWAAFLETHIRNAEPELVATLGDDVDDYIRVRVSDAIQDYDRYLELGESETEAKKAALADLIGDDYEPPEDYEIEDGVFAAFDALEKQSEQADQADQAQRMSLQPGTTKTEGGTTYTLNENHRWTVPDHKDSPGQTMLFDSKPDPTTGKKLGNLKHNDLPILNAQPSCGGGTVCDPPEAKTDNAVELKPLAEYDKILVQFSGGKDSVASVLQLLDQGVDKSQIVLWHQKIDGNNRRFMDWPITEDYCREFAKELGLPIRFQWKDGGFEGELHRKDEPTKGIYYENDDGETVHLPGSGRGTGTRGKWPAQSPNLATRWCSAYLKIDVAARAIRNDPTLQGKSLLFVSGERAEEGGNRENYLESEEHRTHLGESRKVHHWRPVHKMKEKEVWDLLKKHGVNPHPAYRLGYGRLSCQHCIFADKNQVASNREIDPEGFKRIADTETDLAHTINTGGQWTAGGKTYQTKKAAKAAGHSATEISKKALSGDPIAAKADRGTSYVTDKAESLKQLAMSENYNESIKVDPDEWEYPAGAFKRAGGPGSLVKDSDVDKMSLMRQWPEFIRMANEPSFMSLQPGTTKTENGKTYVLNDNHRWTFEDQQATNRKTLQSTTGPEIPEAKGKSRFSGAQKAATFGRGADFNRRSATPVYLSGAWNDEAAKIAKAVGNQIGMLITPDTRHMMKHLDQDSDEGAPELIAVDNGVFGGKFDPTKFRKLLDDLASKEGSQEMTMFVAAPDVFDRETMTGDARATIDQLKPWSEEIRKRGFPVAMVAQDGLQNMLDDIPWDDLDVLFIGGSDEFKLGQFMGEEHSRWKEIWSEAAKRGKPVHVGRVNSKKRLVFAEDNGFDSVDGTFLRFSPGKNGPQIQSWLEDMKRKEEKGIWFPNTQNTLFKMALKPGTQRMSLQPGTTKTENGKTYVLNDNHRWERLTPQGDREYGYFKHPDGGLVHRVDPGYPKKPEPKPKPLAAFQSPNRAKYEKLIDWDFGDEETDYGTAKIKKSFLPKNLTDVVWNIPTNQFKELFGASSPNSIHRSNRAVVTDMLMEADQHDLTGLVMGITFGPINTGRIDQQVYGTYDFNFGEIKIDIGAVINDPKSKHNASPWAPSGSVGFHSVTSPESTLSHEIGHFLHDKKLQEGGSNLKEMRRRWNQIRLNPWDGVATEWGTAKTGEPWAVARRVSDYAATEPIEFVAEVFAGLRDGKIYDDDVMHLYAFFDGPTTTVKDFS